MITLDCITPHRSYFRVCDIISTTYIASSCWILLFVLQFVVRSSFCRSFRRVLYIFLFQTIPRTGAFTLHTLHSWEFCNIFGYDVAISVCQLMQNYPRIRSTLDFLEPCFVSVVAFSHYVLAEPQSFKTHRLSSNICFHLQRSNVFSLLPIIGKYLLNRLDWNDFKFPLFSW